MLVQGSLRPQQNGAHRHSVKGNREETMQNDEGLLSVIYTSAATRLLDDAELEGLLRGAREHNAQQGITGILLYGDGNFMQLLEGPEEAVAGLYARIRRDPRHHMVTTILEERGRGREFSEWSMAYRRIDAPTWLRLSQSAGARGQGADSSVLKGMLAAFWKSVA